MLKWVISLMILGINKADVATPYDIRLYGNSPPADYFNARAPSFAQNRSWAKAGMFRPIDEKNALGEIRPIRPELLYFGIL
jgi:hypothetical protein